MNLRVYMLFVLQVMAATLLLMGCSEPNIGGPVQVRLIKNNPGRCNYEIAPVTLNTLYRLNDMSGTIGRVVYHPDNLDNDPTFLDLGLGFKSVDVSFSESGGIYTPNDMNTLYAASLYYAIESAYLLFQRLDPKTSTSLGGDLAAWVPNLAETMIVYNTRRTNDHTAARDEVHDNAEYLAIIPEGTLRVSRNYFFAYPNQDVTQVPLGLNTGVMVHEFTHMAMQHLFRSPGNASGVQADSTSKPTQHTLDALDEGMADYFGFVATQDPAFFLCSFPNENRDLAVPKAFTQDVVSEINLPYGDENFDPHTAGAVWAAIQYEIGSLIGHENNARSLVRLMPALLTCVEATNGTKIISADFKSIAQCHVNVLGQLGYDTNAARSVYNGTGSMGGRLGVYGGF